MSAPVTKGAKALPKNAAHAPAQNAVQAPPKNGLQAPAGKVGQAPVKKAGQAPAGKVGQAPVKKAAASTIGQGSSQAQQLTKPATNNSVNGPNGASKPAAGAKVVKDEAEAMAVFKNAVKAKLFREVHVIRKLASVRPVNATLVARPGKGPAKNTR